MSEKCVDVRRIPQRCGKHVWAVLTPCCGDPFAVVLPGVLSRPWAVAADWNAAMWWALWHHAEHERTACPYCDHRPPLPKVTILDARTVRIGDDRMFVSVRGGWREVTTPADMTTTTRSDR